jgi:hypothetical protein
MRRIDELPLNYPFADARMLCDMLNGKGIRIGRKHVGTLMDKVGVRLSGGDSGLGHPQCAGTSGVDQHDHGPL